MVDSNSVDDAALIAALESLRDRGALGEPSLPGAVAHSEVFLAPIPAHARRLIDLGSGGGLPGLVLAARRPDLQITLTDRRERRADLLRLACSRLGFDDRVTVLAVDVIRLGRRPEHAAGYDVVTARSFGAPQTTIAAAVSFVAPDGIIVVSEPPDSVAATGERWNPDLLRSLGLAIDGGFPHVRVFRRCG